MQGISTLTILKILLPPQTLIYLVKKGARQHGNKKTQKLYTRAQIRVFGFSLYIILTLKF